MDNEIKIIEKYIAYREEMEYKKLMGYNLSYTEKMTLEKYKEEAIKAKAAIEEENKKIKKMIKSIK